MKIPFVDLKKDYESIQSETENAIQQVIAGSAFIGGKPVQQFEEDFAGYLGSTHCIGCANGTDAIEILLTAFGIGHGDEVLVPAHTWISTAEAVSSIGAKPVFVDTHPSFFTMDVTRIESVISPKTKAIIPVHLYGLPAEMEEIMQIADKHKLIVIEDCAQAHGATYKGKKLGTIGHAASFSFYPSKNLGAIGDAGCMVTSNQEIARKCRMISNHGQLKKHDHQIEGRNSRLDGIQAAVLSVKLKYLDQWNTLRIKHAALYNNLLANKEIITPAKPDYSKHVYHLYVIKSPQRDLLQQKLKNAGIETAVHYPVPLPLLKAYEHLNHRPQEFPISVQSSQKILSLPMYPGLPEGHIRQVCSLINE